MNTQTIQAGVYMLAIRSHSLLIFLFLIHWFIAINLEKKKEVAVKWFEPYVFTLTLLLGISFCFLHLFPLILCYLKQDKIQQFKLDS